MCNLYGDIQICLDLTGKLSLPTTGSGDYDFYEGTYNVVPKAAIDQNLDTTDKILTNDVTITAVPRKDTDNTSGGSTVYIAEN